MKRTLLLMGWFVITLVIFGQDFLLFDPTPIFDQDSGEIAGHLPHSLPWTYWVLGLVIWYALCGINIILEWMRRPVMLFGRYKRTAGPGLVWIDPLFYSTLPDVPVQDVVRDLEAPNIQTKNNVGVGLIAALTYRISPDKVKDAVVEVAYVEHAVLKRALTTLGDKGGITTLDQFLEHRQQFSADVKAELQERVGKWGVTIQALEIKTFKINDERIEQAIAMRARAEKEAEAELTRANMQKQIAAALNEAAETYNANGRWLKGIETLVEMCRSAQNNTILIPTDLQAMLGSLTRAVGMTDKPVVPTTPAAEVPPAT